MKHSMKYLCKRKGIVQKVFWSIPFCDEDSENLFLLPQEHRDVAVISYMNEVLSNKERLIGQPPFFNFFYALFVRFQCV